MYYLIGTEQILHVVTGSYSVTELDENIYERYIFFEINNSFYELYI
jgi:hypothetical protein